VERLGRAFTFTVGIVIRLTYALNCRELQLIYSYMADPVRSSSDTKDCHL